MPAEPLATMHTAANSDNLTLPSGALWGPGASVTPEEALLSHTVGGAVACNLESEVGVLRYALRTYALALVTTAFCTSSGLSVASVAVLQSMVGAIEINDAACNKQA